LQDAAAAHAYFMKKRQRRGVPLAHCEDLTSGRGSMHRWMAEVIINKHEIMNFLPGAISMPV